MSSQLLKESSLPVLTLGAFAILFAELFFWGFARAGNFVAVMVAYGVYGMLVYVLSYRAGEDNKPLIRLVFVRTLAVIIVPYLLQIAAFHIHGGLLGSGIFAATFASLFTHFYFGWSQNPPI